MDTSLINDLPLMILAGTLVVYWVLAYFLMYSMTRFGVGKEPKLASFVFLMGSIALTIIVIVIYAQLGHGGLTESVNKFM